MFTLKLQETMSGWIELNSTRKQEALAFDINVLFTQRLQPWKPQPFSGMLYLRDRGYQTEVHGYLSFKLSGPRYGMKFHHPELGLVELKGEKSYDLANLKESLTVCPLTVFQQGEAVGYAEVAYRDSILAFPLQSLRLVRAEPRVGFQ